MPKKTTTPQKPRVKAVNGIKIQCKYSELLDIMEMKPHPKNNNIHSQEQVELLGALFRIHGWRVPITVSSMTGHIVRGEGRYRAALFLGMKKVPVDIQHYDNEAEEYADLIADNQVASYSNRDTDIMLNALAEMEALDEITAEMLGYYEDEYKELLQGFLNEGGEGQGKGDPDQVPKLQEKADSEPGRLYELGGALG